MAPDSASLPSTDRHHGIDIRRLPWNQRLASDYAYDFASLSDFFAGDPSSEAAWRDAVARARAVPRSREIAAEILRQQLTDRGAPPEAIAAADALRRPETVAVVTGQQAVVFGGPMYTLYKALTALKLAERLRRDGVEAVAAFWVHGDDHDWEEIRSIRILDAGQAPQRIEIGVPPGAGSAPVAAIALDGTVEQALAALGDRVPATEFTVGLMDQLRAAYTPGRGAAEAFARWLDRVLGPRGLVVFEGSDPAAKPLGRRIFVEELRDPGRTSEIAREAGRRLEQRGYHAQVIPPADGVALFHLDGARVPIRRDGLKATIGETARSFSSLVEEAESDPARFSPNVLTRPIVQDLIFPTVAYVAGPSELAYLAQLKGVYERFGLSMPLIYPRATATILDSAAVRFLSRYELPIESLQGRDDSALNRLLERQLPDSVEASFDAAGDAVRQALERLAAEVRLVDPTLEGTARSTLGKMSHELQTFHGKMIQAAKRKDETLRRQFERVRALAFPEGEPQERALGIVHFLNRYGPAFIERLADDLPLDPRHHWLLAI